MKGYLAYLGDKPVGWCNANDKTSYPRLMKSKEISDEKGEKTCSIVCYVIAPDYRRKGVASQILDFVIKSCSEKGYDFVEAYPRKGELSNAFHYHGPLSMYKRAGFSISESFQGFDIVRKKL